MCIDHSLAQYYVWTDRCKGGKQEGLRRIRDEKGMNKPKAAIRLFARVPFSNQRELALQRW